MFSRVTLFHSDECHTLSFEPHKTYLLMMAQGCDSASMCFDTPHATVYTITVPAVIWKAHLYHDALLCCELLSHSHILFCRTEKDAPTNTLNESHTILMFVNWLDPKIYRYIDKLFSLSGEDVTIMGVGCGRMDTHPFPVISLNGRELNDGFLIIFSSHNASVGAAHGSVFHDGYYIAHTQNSNHILTINGEKAFDFYAKKIKKDFNEEVTEETIFTVGLKYPLGLGSTQEEQPLRVPAAVKDGGLIVAGPLDQESIVCFMKSSPSSLLKASSIAINHAKKQCHSVHDKECFIIECVGRHLILGDDFPQELQAIAFELNMTSRQYGVLSLGEIANSADKYIEYFNESCVIGLLHAPQ